MSMYGDCNYPKNNLYDEIREFLESHPISELMEVVRDAVEAKEYMEEEE